MFKSFVGAFPAALDAESSEEPGVPVLPMVPETTRETTESSSSPKQDLLVSASILQKIDQLREKNIGKHVPLPQLVVVGDQSSGKSSLLESLTGIPFARDVELCTRYATQITQRRDDVSRVEVSIIPWAEASEAHKKHVAGYRNSGLSPQDFRKQFPAILKEVNARMGIRTNQSSGYSSDSGYTSDESASGSDKLGSHLKTDTSFSHGSGAFSKDVLKIEICGPSVDYLTVIDVPGMFDNPNPGITTKEDIALVKEMVQWYIQDKRTVILAVLPCNIDIANQKILTLAKEVDPAGERTLGILTKPDLVTEPSVQAIVRNIVLGKKQPLQLGYFLVRSRGADMDEADFNHREDEFKKAAWRSLPSERVGVKALKARLAGLLGDMARHEFPQLRKEIGHELNAAREDLEGLGARRASENEQRLFLGNVAKAYEDLVTRALEAQYAGNAAFSKMKELRLVTQVVNLADAFNQEFQQKSVAHRFQTDDDDEDTVSDTGLNTGANAMLEFAHDIDLEDFPELEGIIADTLDVEDPKDGIMEWMRDKYAQFCSMDLGTSSSTVWASAWYEQTEKWGELSRAFVSRVIVAIYRFISAALKVACHNDHVREQLWSAMQDEVLRRYKAGMDAADLLVTIERRTKPYTLQHRFNERRQKARGGRIADRLLHLSRSGSTYEEEAEVTVEQVRTATEKKPNAEDIVEKLHDDLHAYYDIARSRFVDNVLTQAVNYHLLFGNEVTPLGVFSYEWVLKLQRNELEAIAGESTFTKERRAELERKIDDLTAAKEILK